MNEQALSESELALRNRGAVDVDGAGMTPPPKVPDYELLRRIGHGSYGEVWLARNVLGAYRAVKVVQRRTFSHGRPFEREFEGIKNFEPVSRLHDTQVQIFHVGRHDECFYYVMELADDAHQELKDQNSAQIVASTGSDSKISSSAEDGGFDTYVPHTLKLDLSRRSRLSVDECIQIGLALTQALEDLHGHGLIHRDVKPSNIIFVGGKPKLADVGLVTDLEATASFVGTEGYIPPEGPTTPQADIYSLGKVLYETCTGKDRLKFPEPPTQWEIGEEDATLFEFHEILLKACEQEPRKRYQSARQMRADISLLQSGKSVKRLHVLERRLALVTRSVVITGLIAVLALGGYVFARRQTRLALERSQVETRLRQQAEANERKARQVVQLLNDMLKRVGPSTALGRDTTMLRDILDEAALSLGKELEGQPDVAAELRDTIGQVYYDLGEFAKAARMHGQALEERVRYFGSEHAEVAASLQHLAEALRQTGHLDEARATNRQALAMRRKVLGNGHRDVAGSLLGLGILLHDHSELVEAESCFREGLMIMSRQSAKDDPQIADLREELCFALRDQDRLEEAESFARQALAMRRSLNPNNHPDVASSLNNLGLVLRRQGKLAEAELAYREALPTLKHHFGNEHVKVATTLNNLARALQQQGRLKEAESVHREALAIRRKLFPDGQHTSIANSLVNLAVVLWAEGRLQEAEDMQCEALDMARTKFGPETTEVAMSLDSLGLIFRDQGKLSEAEAMHRQALSIRAKILDATHSDVAATVENLGVVLRKQGKQAEAETLYSQRLALLRPRLPAEDQRLVAVLAPMTLALLAQEKFTRAELTARECLAICEKRVPDDWQTFDAHSLLGASLLGQGKHTDAEPFLLSGCNGLKERREKIPSAAKTCFKESLQRLMQLYETTGRSDQAAKGQQELLELRNMESANRQGATK